MHTCRRGWRASSILLWFPWNRKLVPIDFQFRVKMVRNVWWTMMDSNPRKIRLVHGETWIIGLLCFTFNLLKTSNHSSLSIPPLTTLPPPERLSRLIFPLHLLPSFTIKKTIIRCCIPVHSNPHITLASSAALYIVSVPSLVLRKLLSPSELSPPFHYVSTLQASG